ncbi:MAG: hypothetical protein QOF79_594, partial [Actinomycetota bacterium]|nr:hypothetical protein [Actinomycetota bacterium]
MKLETWVDRMHENMSTGSTKSGPVSSHIEKVAKALPSPTQAKLQALAWLDEALEVLERRNAILHSQLAAFWFGDTPVPKNQFDWELRLVNARRKSSVAFTPEGLLDEQGHIDGVLATGVAVD